MGPIPLPQEPSSSLDADPVSISELIRRELCPLKAEAPHSLNQYLGLPKEQRVGRCSAPLT